MKYNKNYAHAYQEKNKLSLRISTIEYGQIFHVTRIAKYYCKNMKYRINIYHDSRLNRPESVSLTSLARQ